MPVPSLTCSSLSGSCSKVYSAIRNKINKDTLQANGPHLLTALALIILLGSILGPITIGVNVIAIDFYLLAFMTGLALLFFNIQANYRSENIHTPQPKKEETPEEHPTTPYDQIKVWKEEKLLPGEWKELNIMHAGTQYWLGFHDGDETLEILCDTPRQREERKQEFLSQYLEKTRARSVSQEVKPPPIPPVRKSKEFEKDMEIDDSFIKVSGSSDEDTNAS